MNAMYPITPDGAIRWADWRLIAATNGRGWILYRIGVSSNGVKLIQHDPDPDRPFVHPKLDDARARANILNGAF